MRLSSQSENGTTLAEVLISALLVAIFFASIFEVNAICLRLVAGSKENVAAIQGVQDRLETMRNLAFADLTTPTYLRDTLLPAPSNVSDFAKRVIEDVTVIAYDTDSAIGGTTGTGINVRRPAGQAATPYYVGSPDPNIANARAVLVTVKYSWTLAGRSRAETTSSIVAAGIKK